MDREIFIARSPIAGYGALTVNKHKPLSQLMSKRQESEYCERYRPQQSKYFSYVIDAQAVFCDEWSGKVSRGGPVFRFPIWARQARSRFWREFLGRDGKCTYYSSMRDAWH
jgi:hypothetical protein